MRNTGGLASLFAKEGFTAVGLMSGTSMDGVDAALVSLDADLDSQSVELLGFASLDYPEELHEALGDLAIGHETTAEEVATLNTGVAVTFAGSFFDVCRRANVEPQSVDFIGSHGQTVAHVPPQAKSGNPIAGTLQLGPPSMIAALTGVTTVGDFRSGDVAVGGQGAPLAPYVDFLLRRSGSASRLILNIGGIANVTYLPRACAPEAVVAFDTGPGNMVIDALYQSLYPGQGPYDADGSRAMRGSPSRELVDEFISNPYFQLPPPKSAGHREFGAPFAWQFQSRGEEKGLRRADILASGVSFTARTIADAVRDFVRPRGPLDVVYVSGGGVHNDAIMSALVAEMGGVPCRAIDELGIPADAKEAVDFAVLAREALLGRPNVLVTATGAARALVLGTIAQGAKL
jgi:anhydro-N-acetylmuramic acid kinase